MLHLTYFKNKLIGFFIKKKIGKIPIFIFFLIAVVFLLPIFVVNFINNNNKKELLASYKEIPLDGEFVQQELIVQFHEGYSPDQLRRNISEKNSSSIITLAKNISGEQSAEEKLLQIDNDLKELGVISYNRLVEENPSDSLGRFYTLAFSENIDLREAQDKLSKLFYIASTEPNRVFHLDRIPNDPSYSQLWGLQKIQAPQAWDTSVGSESIVVAVIDSGIDASHPEFIGKIIPGYDYIDNDANTADDLGHGTHVAGTVGAIGDNGIGVVGVNWNVKVLPIRICKKTNVPPAYNTCNLNYGAQGIQYAINNNARVVNMSLGGSGQCGFVLQNAIDDGINSGITFAVAAGNGDKFGNPQDASGYSPANCNGVITVGASTPSDSRASFSNFGSTVEIAAPGTSIYSTWPGGKYKTLQGTSMASPHVAGAAALLLSANPGLSPAEVAECLISTADPISTDKPIGHRLNIGNAISQNCIASNPITPTVTSTPLTPTVTSVPPKATITSIPTITNAPQRYNIALNVFTDNNKNGVPDTGDTPYQGAIVNLTGPVSRNLVTDSSGDLIFSNLIPGNYSLKFIIPDYIIAPYSVTITNKDIEFWLSLPPGASLTPPILVTKAPVPTNGVPDAPTSTPTPTPITTYNCRFDTAGCTTGQKNLQLCPLICTPN